MLIVERFIVARLRNRRFLSLGDLNEAIWKVLGDLNARLMRKLGASRREFFETIDRPALLPLPAEPYAYAEWRRCRVVPDYHVELHGHFYSVPSRLIREVVEARVTDTTVEVFHAGQRIAAHARSATRRRHTTIPEHILDDRGLAPLTGEQRRDLLEIMDDRHERGSSIVTSQVPVDHWHEVIGDPTIADAVLDRLIHNAHRLILKGESLRRRAAKALMLDAGAAA